MPNEITKHLRPEEIKHLCYVPFGGDKYEFIHALKLIAEALAECRRLMEKHRWVKINEFAEPYCIGCGRRKHRGCTSSCLWAQAIKGE